MKKTSAAVLAVPLAASMLLAGCSGDPKPSASTSSTPRSSSTPTASATPTVSPTSSPVRPTDPNIPADARAHTPAGAEAFVKYFFKSMNESWTGPKVGILFPLCETSSKACAAYEKTATRLTRDGHRYNGDPVTIKFIGVLDATNPSKYDVLVTLVQERRSEIDAAGKIVITDKRKDFRVTVALSYTDHGWSVATLKIMR